MLEHEGEVYLGASEVCFTDEQYGIIILSMTETWVALYCHWRGRKTPALQGAAWRSVWALVSGYDQASISYVLRSRGFWEAAALAGDEELLRQARNVIEAYAAAGWVPVLPMSYPPGLLSKIAGKAPPLFWATPSPSGLSRPLAAVVGSRHPSREEASFAADAGEVFARLGFGVVSGGAIGCDQIAGKAAYEAGGFVAHFLPGSAVPCVSGSASICRSPESPAFDRLEALRRNLWVHASAQVSLCISSRFQEGGSWQGMAACKRERLAKLLVFIGRQPSTGNVALAKLGVPLVANASDLEAALAKPQQEQTRLAL
jgi:predicted Rossmann fold nucleotide-binding protein DprA/Smf involved in DNA uptake